MQDHTPSNHDGHRWTLRSVPHLIKAMGDFWASDLNRAAIEMVNPQPGETLLDVGAGIGAGTIVAAQRIEPDGRIVAVDPSTFMRGALRLRRLWQRTRPLIDIRDGSAEHLPIESGSIDTAYAINATHHFDDIEVATAELARVLKPGGRLLLIEEDFTNPEHPYNQHRYDTANPEPIDAATIVKLLSTAGLTATRRDHHPIAGVTATIISATAPGDHLTSDADQGQPHPGGPS